MRRPRAIRFGGAERGLRAGSGRRGIPLRTLAPNMITALALCSGLTAIRFAIAAQWELAVSMILAAAVLDGLDGSVARLVRGQSRFGAELDSLSDAISFGVAPALVLYLWSLIALPSFGWLCALIFAVFCALRLARFNAAIDLTDQPHKSAGFLTGVPAPAGAALAMLPLLLWIVTQDDRLRMAWPVAIWIGLVALLMVSSLATFSWASLRLRQTIRFEAILILVFVVAALVSAPWRTLIALCLLYLASIPFSIRAYGRIKRLRANSGPAASAAVPSGEPDGS